MLLYDPEFPPAPHDSGATSASGRHSGQAAAHVPNEGRASASEEGATPASREARIFRDASGVTWWAHEVSGEHLGARAATCLLVVSSLELRRVWRYPADWRSLPPDELLRLQDQSTRRTETPCRL